MDRRLQEFKIYRTDISVTEEKLRGAVKEELEGPSKFLGYRAVNYKIRQEHNLKFPRRIVHAMMFDIDPEGLQERAFANKKKPCKGKIHHCWTKLGPLSKWACKAHGVPEKYFPACRLWIRKQVENNCS